MICGEKYLAVGDARERKLFEEIADVHVFCIAKIDDSRGFVGVADDHEVDSGGGDFPRGIEIFGLEFEVAPLGVNSASVGNDIREQLAGEPRQASKKRDVHAVSQDRSKQVSVSPIGRREAVAVAGVDPKTAEGSAEWSMMNLAAGGLCEPVAGPPIVVSADQVQLDAALGRVMQDL